MVRNPAAQNVVIPNAVRDLLTDADQRSLTAFGMTSEIYLDWLSRSKFEGEHRAAFRAVFDTDCAVVPSFHALDYLMVDNILAIFFFVSLP